VTRKKPVEEAGGGSWGQYEDHSPNSNVIKGGKRDRGGSEKIPGVPHQRKKQSKEDKEEDFYRGIQES